MKRKTMFVIPVALGIMILGVSLCLVDGAGAGILVPPQRLGVFPPPESHTAGVTTPISITYDQDMDPLTVNPQTFAVHARQTGWLTQTLSVSGGTIQIDPLSALHAGELVQVSATTQTLSLGGEGPITPTVWQFSTAPWGGNAYFHQVQSLSNDESRDNALGDLDGDGDLDIMTSQWGELINVWHNDGAASFTQVQVITLPYTATITDVELGDLDVDGDLDAFLVNYSDIYPDRVLLNNGDGTFSLDDQVVMSNYNTYGELGDLDGDGDLDIFVTAGGYEVSTIRTWLNDGTGNFTLGSDFDSAYQHTGVALGDLDGDGDLDAFTAGYNNSYSKVWLNDGMGFFSEYQIIQEANTWTPLLGDLDGDGDLDVYLANASSNWDDLPDEVWLNDGTGYFMNSGQSQEEVFCLMPALGDLDADGDLDVYLSEFYAGPDEVWLNDGLGNLSPGHQMNENLEGGGVVLGDLDGDGNVDAVTADFFNSHDIFLNGDWTQAEPVLEALGYPGFVQCADYPNRIYLVGGGGPNPYQWRNQVYRYDAVEDEWSQLASLPKALFAVAASCYEGKIYAAGGWNNYAENTLYIYDITTDTWTQGANLPRVVSGASLGAWDGKLYLVGGSPVAIPCPPVADVDIYDIQSNTWSAQAGESMPTPTTASGWVQRGAYLFVVGGMSGNFDHNIAATQRYDLSNDQWEMGPLFYSQRAWLALASTENHLYAIGGDLNGSGLSLQTDLVERLDLSLWPEGNWTDIYDPIPQAGFLNVGFCTEAMSGGEIWSVGGGYGINPNYTMVDTNLYYPAEACLGNTFALALEPEILNGSAKPGESVTYQLTLTNTGELPDAYDLEVISAWPAEIDWTPGALDIGESRLVMVTVQVPLGSLPGEMDAATLHVNSQGDPSQTASANLITTAEEFYAPDLATETPALWGCPGEMLVYSLQLSNQGNITDTYDLSLSGNLWDTELSGEQFMLGIGESVELTVTVTIPIDALPGETDIVTLAATSQGDPEVSATATLTSSTYVYGVAVSPESAEMWGMPGDTLTYTLLVTNTGEAGDYYTIVLSGNLWTTEAPTETVWLESGITTTVEAVVHIPLDAWAGEWDMALLTITSQHDPTEYAVVTLTSSTYVYGVAVSPESAEMWGMPGDTLTYTLLVTNTGQAGDYYTIVLSGNLWTTEAPTQTVWLESGITTTVEAVVHIPLDAWAGEWDVALLTITSQHDPTEFAVVTLTSRVPVWYTYLPMIFK